MALKPALDKLDFKQLLNAVLSDNGIFPITSVCQYFNRIAIIEEHDVQQLFKIEFIKSGSTPHVVEATANHRWILKDGTETTNLKIGDIIYKPENTFGEFNYDKATPQEKLYWCYGMVYGDGTKVKSNGEYKYSLIRLCGGDKQFAGRFEEMNFKTSTSDSLTGDFIAYTGTYLKTAPNPEIDSPELIRAFCAGYLQARRLNC